MKNNRNVRVLAKKSSKTEWFDIYLVFSGQEEYLMSHRSHNFLYDSLKDGVNPEEIRRNRTSGVKRWENQKRRGARIGVIDHLLKVIDDYIMERDEYYRQKEAC